VLVCWFAQFVLRPVGAGTVRILLCAGVLVCWCADFVLRPVVAGTVRTLLCAGMHSSCSGLLRQEQFGSSFVLVCWFASVPVCWCAEFVPSIDRTPGRTSMTGCPTRPSVTRSNIGSKV
jgi:hypothetical protein